MIAVVVLEGLAILLLAVLVGGLLRSHAEILRSLHRLGVDAIPGVGPHSSPGHSSPVQLRTQSVPASEDAGLTGRSAYDVSGTTLEGEVVQYGVGGSHATLIAFLSSGCSTCAPLWHGLVKAIGPGSTFAGARLVVVARDPAQESQADLASLCPADVAMLMSTEAWEQYTVPGSPYFAFVPAGSATVAGEGVARSWEQVTELLARAGHLGPNLDRRPLTDDFPAGHRQSREPISGRQRGRTGREREADVDAELAAAGVHPGDASLYPPTGASGGVAVGTSGGRPEQLPPAGTGSEPK